jgi:hypothetical protein
VKLKSGILKLSLLLAQFLYINKELNLAGIGRFQIESFPADDEVTDKISKSRLPSVISFQYDTSVKEDPNLVFFISSQTGKMKSLAAGDLDSYLELAKQFLNIGKPFLLEGIGTLTKSKSGKLEFTPGPLLHEKGKEAIAAETDLTSTTEDSFTDYEEIFAAKKPRVPASKRRMLWLAVFAGIGLTVWGGYLFYKKTKKTTPPASIESVSISVQDTAASSKPDTTFTQRKNDTSFAGTYRFVIEQAGRSRALARYGDLKKWGIHIQMETKDSITFKLFFILAASPSDTAQIRDSLNLLYGTMGKTTIEQ